MDQTIRLNCKENGKLTINSLIHKIYLINIVCDLYFLLAQLSVRKKDTYDKEIGQNENQELCAAPCIL